MIKKVIISSFIFIILGGMLPAFAERTVGQPGKISGLSVGAAALSLIIWPGLGQVILDNPYEKNCTHALLGLTVVFRLWSAYDAFVDRKGGVWHNRI